MYHDQEILKQIDSIMLSFVCSVISSQMQQNVIKTKKYVAHQPQVSVSVMFLQHFDVLCDLLLNRPICWVRKPTLLVIYQEKHQIENKFTFGNDLGQFCV